MFCGVCRNGKKEHGLHVSCGVALLTLRAGFREVRRPFGLTDALEVCHWRMEGANLMKVALFLHNITDVAALDV